MPIQKSIILITVDCLRADHVGFNGYARNVTPFLDSLARNCVTFSDAIVAGAPTYFSFPAMIASRYPLGLGRDVMGIAPGETTIATVLRAAGYRTAAFLAGNPYLSRRCGYACGFDTFEDFLNVIPERPKVSADVEKKPSSFNRWLQTVTRTTRLTAAAYEELYFQYCQWLSAREDDSFGSLRRYPAADALVDRASNWLKEVGDAPFFLWIHFMDPHHPYYPPDEALQSLGVTMTAKRARYVNTAWSRAIRPDRLRRYRDEIISLYDAGVRWVDRQVERLVGALQELRRWEESVFALTGDHGEAFLEHDARYHSPADLHEQLIRVPLLVHSAELPAARFTTPLSLIHLAPTLLEGAGQHIPVDFQGREHWAEIASGTLPDEPAITECVEGCNNPFRMEDRMGPRILAVRSRDSKLVIRFSGKTDDFFDLKTDREERSAVPPQSSRRERASLLRVAQAHLANSQKMRNSTLALKARVREIKSAQCP